MARDRRDLEKSEPSRSQPMTPAATSHPHFGSHKLRMLAASGLGEAGSMQLAVERMMRTAPETYDDPTLRPTPHVIDAADVTRGLGLENADEQRVQQLVTSTVPDFTQKTQTQRIVHARGRLASVLRDSMKHVSSDQRDEITRRATALWKRDHQTDYGKGPTVRFRGARSVAKSMTPVIPMGVLVKGAAAAKLPAARGQFGGADPSNVSSGGRYHPTWDSLEKGVARGGKYYRRIPTGNPKDPYRYFYHEDEYKRFLAGQQHVHGPEVEQQRQLGLFDHPPQQQTPTPAPLAAPSGGAAAHYAGEAAKHRAAADRARDDRTRLYHEERARRFDALAGVSSGLPGTGTGPTLTVPTHGRPEAQHAGLEVTGTPQPKPVVEIPEPAAEKPTVAAKEHLTEGFAQGKASYAAGRARSGTNPDLDKVLAGYADWSKARRDIMQQHLRGWDAAMLAAPVPEEVAAPPVPVVPIELPTTPKPEKKPTFGAAPPGGWTDADKVPEEHQRLVPAAPESSAEQKAAERKARDANLMLKFEKGQTLVINGKKYQVSIPEHSMKNGRSVMLTPIEQRATQSRWLYISPNGTAMLSKPHSSVRETITTPITGATTREKPWQPPERTNTPVVPLPPQTFTPPPPKTGTPRAEADAEAKRDRESGEYVNDRASKIEQRGEDVANSARHKALEWKSIAAALASGDADKLFTRGFLEKQEPVDMLSRAQRDVKDPKAAVRDLYLHYVAKRFPPKPEIPKIFGSDSVNYSYYDGDRYHTGYKHGTSQGYDRTKPVPTQAEHEKKQRESYYAAWQEVRKILHDAADHGPGLSDVQSYAPMPMERNVLDKLEAAHSDFVSKYGRSSAGTQAIAGMHDLLRKGRRSKNGPVALTNEFAHKSNETYRDNPAGMTENVGRHVADIIEGKSLNATFGTVEEKKGYKVNLADNYDTSKMRRKGPESEYRSPKQALDELDRSAGGKYAMRGVQWGKSVTDEEREHHLKSLVDSFADLTEILGLPPGMASYNGKLAIAIGARGKAGALAHYEPLSNVINLTRVGGAGSLAHEWGHFFDFTVGKAEGGGARAPSHKKTSATRGELGAEGQLTRSAEHPKEGTVRRAVYDLAGSEGWKAFAERIRGITTAPESGFTQGEHLYWGSSEEMFARAFERHVQRKLHASGRENTYLVALKKAASDPGGMWPTDEEVDAMAPHFDRVFRTFAKSDLLHKALGFGHAPAIAPQYRHIVGGMLVVPRG